MSLRRRALRSAPLIPIALGIAVALAGWNVPSKQGPLFAVALPVLGGLLLLSSQRWRPPAPGRIERVLGYAVGTLIALAAWLTVAAQCIVSVASRGEVFFPLWLTGDVAKMVERAGGRVAALERYGLDAVQLAIANMPAASVAEVTSVTLLLLAFASTFLAPMLLLLRSDSPTARTGLDTLSVFISYRRDDSAPYARLLFEQLRPSCRHVVLDVDVLPIGADFRASVELAIDSCDIVIVVIGSNWLGDIGRHRRIRDPDDMVASEVAHALERGRRVLPVLVAGARMPSADELPATIASLTRINALEVRHESFRRDIARLEEHLETVAAEKAVHRAS